MGRKALLTGVTGFLGGYTARCLITDDWQVAAVIRTSSRIDLLPVAVRERIVFYDAEHMDLREIVREAAPDVVFHLAAYYTTIHSYEEIDDLIASNVTFGTKLLDAMSTNGTMCADWSMHAPRGSITAGMTTNPRISTQRQRKHLTRLSASTKRRTVCSGSV